MAAGLLLMDGALGLRGWQWLFITEGALTCLCGVLLKVGALPMLCPLLTRALFISDSERAIVVGKQLVGGKTCISRYDVPLYTSALL